MAYPGVFVSFCFPGLIVFSARVYVSPLCGSPRQFSNPKSCEEAPDTEIVLAVKKAVMSYWKWN